MSGDGSDLVRLLAQGLGQLPKTIAIEGHTGAKPYPPGTLYTNWELSSDRTNFTRRLMQASGIRPDQVTQVREFADQRLRKTPANLRILLIVQYLEKKPGQDAPPSADTGKLPDAAPARDPPAPVRPLVRRISPLFTC